MSSNCSQMTCIMFHNSWGRSSYCRPVCVKIFFVVYTKSNIRTPCNSKYHFDICSTKHLYYMANLADKMSFPSLEGLVLYLHVYSLYKNFLHFLITSLFYLKTSYPTCICCSCLFCLVFLFHLDTLGEGEWNLNWRYSVQLNYFWSLRT